MPSVENVDCRQTAVLWTLLGRDFRGDAVLDTPVELTPPYNGVRWLSKRVQRTLPDGNTVMLDGTIILRQDVVVGSQMWLGTMADWLGTGSATTDEEVVEVIVFNSTPDIRNKFLRREAGFMRKHNKT